MERILVAILNFHQHNEIVQLISDLENQKTEIIIDIYIGDMIPLESEKVNFLNKLRKIKLHNVNYKYVLFDENLGYARGNNEIIKVALENNYYEYVLISNPDIRINNRNTIQKLIENMIRDKKVAVVGPKVLQPNKRQQGPYIRQIPLIYSLKHFLPFLWLPFWKVREFYITKIKKSRYVWRCIGAFMLMRAEQFYEVDMFDENTFLYWEEDILSYKLKQKGYKVLYDPNVSVVHLNNRKNKSNISNFDIDSMKYYFKFSGHAKLSINLSVKSIKFYNFILRKIK